ncbi:HNH endonuclease [Methanosarcina sp. 1.H.T.1A.1]|uniref:RNA-guided endonuclease IscB n=1 Tax=Methanosarcina sp. 1.H.T.1A.1 TaxID=1483602 RepID=UPI0006224C3A|nr:RNA-guided endonuclease IscB [Methanosarcina sp. 1.H.T.1A.1]KKH95327.1 HNH endonuclease [Methanosarcina sp. 1.H.T.1A.1]
MLVFVINQNKKPLMPCKPSKARKLLQAGKAKVVRNTPFTIKLLFRSSGYTQPVTAGMDTGSKVVGCAAIANGKVLYQSEIYLRENVSKKMEQRKMYRRSRRSRKTRYRPARFDNRGNSKKEGRLAPSIRSKLEAHFREKRFVESLLPVTEWKVELASFDIHKITNPEVSGIGYQEGDLKGFYNIKAYVLDRDGYTCQHCRGKSKDSRLHCHHIVFRSQKGTDAPENLIMLCETCHKALHNGEFKLSGKKSKTKHATEVGIIKSQIRKSGWNFAETFGYETKYRREQVLKLLKTHYFDAVAICCRDDQKVEVEESVFLKRNVSKGDYQQRTGKRSEKKIPTGKLFNLRKFDLVKTSKGIGFVKGKRSSGFFAISDMFGNKISDSVNVKKICERLRARTSTLIQQSRTGKFTHSSPELKTQGFPAEGL